MHIVINPTFDVNNDRKGKFYPHALHQRKRMPEKT